jgi:hypothetical protein
MLSSTTAAPRTLIPSLPSRTVNPATRVSGPADELITTVSTSEEAPLITVLSMRERSPEV